MKQDSCLLSEVATLICIIVVLVGGCFSTSADSGRGLYLDGLDDYAALKSGDVFNFSLAPRESITIEAFVFTMATDSARHERQVLIQKAGAFSLEVDFSHTVPGIRFTIGTNSSFFSQTRFLRDLLPGLRHVAIVLTQTSSNLMAALFVDGFGYTPEPLVGSMTSDSPLFVGGGPEGNGFQGWIDEVRISRLARFTGDACVVPNESFLKDSLVPTGGIFSAFAGRLTSLDIRSHLINAGGE